MQNSTQSPGRITRAARFYARHYQMRGLVAYYRVNRTSSTQFTCPVCAFQGRFAPIGGRLHALCPSCTAYPRHRLQALVLRELEKQHDFSALTCLHMAPDGALSPLLRRSFGSYVTADLNGRNVDRALDLRAIDAPDESFDVVYASHVLEHIAEDDRAIAEIRRVLRPGGFAVLPVPILAIRTVEYPRPVPEEAYHVRAPGTDYFERFTGFSDVRVWSSSDFAEEYQVWDHEDRTNPSPHVPRELGVMKGARHPDYVPVCFA